MIFNTQWLDKFGLVLPQPKTEDKPCDNGVLFTSVAVLLGFDFPNFNQLIPFLKPGLIARWRGNNFDQCAWDDYLGFAVACIHLKETRAPREILTYGVKHFFFFNTDGKLEFKDDLLRNFPIWPMMFCAAYPSLKWLAWPLAALTKQFFKHPKELLDRHDTSGFQLQWVYLMGYAKTFSMHDYDYLQHVVYLESAFKEYYHADHPFNNLTETF